MSGYGSIGPYTFVGSGPSLGMAAHIQRGIGNMNILNSTGGAGTAAATGITGGGSPSSNLAMLLQGNPGLIENSQFSSTNSANNNFGGVSQNLQNNINNIQKQRQSTFGTGSLGRSDPNYLSQNYDILSGKLQDMMDGMNSQQMTAARDTGMQNIQQSMLTAQRGLRSMNNAGMPPMTASGQKEELLRQGIQSRADLEKGLTLTNMNMQTQASQLYQQALQSQQQHQLNVDQLNSSLAYQEKMQQLGNPEQLAALQAQMDYNIAQQKQQAGNQDANMWLQGVGGLANYYQNVGM